MKQKIYLYGDRSWRATDGQLPYLVAVGINIYIHKSEQRTIPSFSWITRGTKVGIAVVQTMLMPRKTEMVRYK